MFSYKTVRMERNFLNILNRQTKTRTGPEPKDTRTVKPKMFSVPGSDRDQLRVLVFKFSSFQVYYIISLYSTFFHLHCSQLAIASRGEQWLDVYTREKK